MKKPPATVTADTFSTLANGLTDTTVAHMLRVSRQTAHRWRTSGPAPYMAFALLELIRGRLPAIFGGFAGWRIHDDRLVAPGDHPETGITPGDARAALYLKRTIDALQAENRTLRATVQHQAELLEKVTTEKDFYRRLVREANAFSFITHLKDRE